MSEPNSLQFKPGFENSSLDTPKPAADNLKAACEAAYDGYPNSCSHAVNHVIRTIHSLSEKQWPHRDANLLVDYLSGNWEEVGLERAYELAQNGVVVVGGKKETGHGHVIVVYPGSKKARGGYNYDDKKTGQTKKTRETGSYPRAMSTSMGNWPGAKSKGEKTVWDPWGNDASFSLVKFWARKEDSSSAANVTRLISTRYLA